METSKLFLGQFEHAVDDKNRLFVPSRFRAKDTVPFILTQGLEQCLFLFPPEGWGRLAEKLNTLPLKDKSEERAFKRLLLAGASEVSVDTQGRILIPEMLRSYADIRRETVILGMLHHVEIWSKERWMRYQKNARSSFDRVAPHLEL